MRVGAGVRRSRTFGAAALALLVACFVSGCAPSDDGTLELALNWKPEPEFGGLYAAREQGLFDAAGLPLEITGGPGAPVVQMLVAGKVAFGILNADEVLLARARGDDLVAIFATYQTSPVGIMTHAARGAQSLAELFTLGGKLAVEPGVPFAQYLAAKYGLDGVQVVPYGFSIAPFLTAPDMAMQCYVTAEPIEARRRGADPRVFLVADSGYDPYGAVVVARGALVREDPRTVKALVSTLREGWRRYLDAPSATNVVMHALNPEMDLETFELGAVAQAALIEDDGTRARGLGSMTVERWQQLSAQLLELGILERAVDGAACFVDVDRL